MRAAAAILAVALSVAAGGAASAEPPPPAPRTFGPFATPSAPVTREARPEVHRSPRRPSASFLWLSYLFYRTVVSPIDGPRCSHWPTCSAYAMEAVRRRGALGLLMTVDRVWMTNYSSILRPLPLKHVGEVWRSYHPVDETLTLPVPEDER